MAASTLMISLLLYACSAFLCVALVRTERIDPVATAAGGGLVAFACVLLVTIHAAPG